MQDRALSPDEAGEHQPGWDASPVASAGPDDEYVTLRLRRAHLYGAVGLLIGLIAGLVVARVTGFGQERGTPTVAASQAPSPTAPPVEDVSVAGQPTRGPDNAKVTIVEFLDFECPFCKRYNDETLPRIEATYGDKVRFVVRNFPLAIHPAAEKAAEAGECAYAQGKFWEYHDLLFKNQSALDVDSLKRYARDLQLDGARFDTCLDGGEGAAQVSQDVGEGDRVAVSATPTFFVNGHRLVGAQPYEQFKSAIDAALH